jgi:hypothetical protein
LVYFVAIWCILWQFGTFFPVLWCCEKSGNPGGILSRPFCNAPLAGRKKLLS